MKELMVNRHTVRRHMGILVASGLILALSITYGATAARAQDAHPVPGSGGDPHGEALPEGGTGDATHPSDTQHPEEGEEVHHNPPSFVATLPFITILLCIAILPLLHKTEHWWHKNQNKLLISAILAILTLTYYMLRGTGFGHGEHAVGPGTPTVFKVLEHAVLDEYIPFIVLLFSLYTISGGIQLRGDLKATPLTNTTFIAVGTAMASFVGTTGAAMLLIRPLLQTNSERKYVRHTVIFFIFLVCNIGGSLLPVGDPPLFLGYLKGVPFLWTMGLWKQWLFCSLILLGIYYVWDTRAYRKEPPLEHLIDETHIEPLRIKGTLNFVWLLGVVLAVALLDPSKKIPGTDFSPPQFVREAVQLGFVALAWLTGSRKIRQENRFDFFAILEVAALFIGIFITMQVPVEILNLQGESLGLKHAAHFFWATGVLSSFLDNAPTYVVFFETANAMTHQAGDGILQLLGGAFIRKDLLVGISLGAVFMGANTYIGNGPNFMVKSIAEQNGVRMPSFFGYMLYSGMVLIPLFVVVMLVFLV